MRNIADTINRLAAARNQRTTPANSGIVDRLSDIGNFGSNPGALRARTYIPKRLAADAPLVVVLHGCTQTAAAYDHGAGWSRMADRGGFAVLFPEQQRSNNANLCFNWFVPGDIRRDCGEALSIRQMIDAMVEKHGLDRRRIFVTGLSAGGAMASVMLAAYPDVFAGGAIIAGLPYGTASSIPEAFDRMRGHGGPTDAQLKARLADASGHKGPWPRVSVWHGGADHTVSPANADKIVRQWQGVHGLAEKAARDETVGGHRRRVWQDKAGRDVVESFSIAGMAHGTPLDTNDGIGVRGPFMIDVGISSTLHICNFWGLSQTSAGEEIDASQPVRQSAGSTVSGKSLNGEILRPAATGFRAPDKKPSGVRQIIEDALRKAGLMP